MKAVSLGNFYIFLLSLVLFSLVPSRVARIKYLGYSAQLTIQSAKNNPPRVAFEEINRESVLKNSEWQLLKKSSFSRNLNEDLIKMKVSTDPISDFRVRKIILPTMAIYRPIYPDRSVAQESGQDSSWVNNLSQSQRIRLNLAQEKQGLKLQDWSVPEWESAIAEQKYTTIGDQPKYFSDNEKSKNTSAQVQPTIEDGQFHLSNRIELESGLPIGGEYHVIINRLQDGVLKETGSIDPVNGMYRINVADLSGSLRAQVIHSSGAVLGEGFERLNEIRNRPANDRWAPTITVKKSSSQVASYTRPFDKSVGSFGIPSASARPANRTSQDAIPLVSYYSPSIQKSISTHSDSVMNAEGIQRGSTIILQSTAKDYVQTIQLVNSGIEAETTMFSENMINALRSIVRDSRNQSAYEENGSVIWGRVIQNRKPVTGARVSIVGVEGHQIIYFNKYLLPDLDSAVTSENGYFAILDLQEGLYHLNAILGQKIIGFQNVLTSEKSVSPIVLDTTQELVNLEIKSYDAFSGEAVKSVADIQGGDDLQTVDGSVSIFLPKTNGKVLAKVEAQDNEYLSAKYNQSANLDFLHFPLVKKSWIFEVLNRKNIQLDQGGVIVGFVPSEDFQVYLPHEENYDSKNIFYFNSDGELTDSGVQGGGFILSKVPYGVQSVVVSGINSGLLLSDVIQVSSDLPTILKFQF